MTLGVLDQWLGNQSVFGHLSSPVPYTFVSLDRPRDSVLETLETMKLVEVVDRLICLDELPTDATFDTVATLCRKKYADSRFLIMEGFQTFAGDGINRYDKVQRLLRHVSKSCGHFKETILGVCHSSKIKKGQEFIKGRDRIGGTVAWSAFSETIIIVDADEKTKVRTVDIYPRNAPEEQHQLIMSTGGVLIPCPKEKGEQLYAYILSVPEGQIFTRQWILDTAESLELGERTAERTLKRAVEEQQAEQLGSGEYKRTLAF